MRKASLYICILFSISLLFSCTTNQQIDLIVYNAKVYTVDSSFRTVEAIAINNGVFIDRGNSQDLLNKYDAKEKIDAAGKFVYPGFYDSHGHFFLLSDDIDEVYILLSSLHVGHLTRYYTYTAA